jgi:hypothetical protein
VYRLFDLCIDSQLELPGLAAASDTLPDWSVVVRREGEAEHAGLQWFHTWKDADGHDVMAIARRGSAYLLDFDGLARFLIDFGGRRIVVRPAPGCTDATLAHLLMDQVLPRAVCHQGRLVLHASAVALHDGSAVAFAGVSGRGKSTLASAFYRAGYALLGDDCLLLEQRDGEVIAVPPYVSMRLWSDSADALFPGERQAGMRASRMAHYTNKKVLNLEDPAAPVPAPIGALFLIEPPGPLRIDPAGGMAVIMALVEAQFALDVVDEAAVRRSFAAVKQVAGHVPVMRLTYPRDYAALTEVIEAVAGAAEQCPTAGAELA